MSQTSRSHSAGLPLAVVVGGAELLLKVFRNLSSLKERRMMSFRPVALPYVQTFSHRIKHVAEKFDVPVVLSAP